jgi:hypothetical protein
MSFFRSFFGDHNDDQRKYVYQQNTVHNHQHNTVYAGYGERCTGCGRWITGSYCSYCSGGQDSLFKHSHR